MRFFPKDQEPAVIMLGMLCIRGNGTPGGTETLGVARTGLSRLFHRPCRPGYLGARLLIEGGQQVDGPPS
jgi:hypothetical protein